MLWCVVDGSCSFPLSGRRRTRSRGTLTRCTPGTGGTMTQPCAGCTGTRKPTGKPWSPCTTCRGIPGILLQPLQAATTQIGMGMISHISKTIPPATDQMSEFHVTGELSSTQVPTRRGRMLMRTPKWKRMLKWTLKWRKTLSQKER